MGYDSQTKAHHNPCNFRTDNFGALLDEEGAGEAFELEEADPKLMIILCNVLFILLWRMITF